MSQPAQTHVSYYSPGAAWRGADWSTEPLWPEQERQWRELREGGILVEIAEITGSKLPGLLVAWHCEQGLHQARSIAESAPLVTAGLAQVITSPGSLDP